MGNPRPDRPWWATWPAVIVWFALAALAVLPAALGWGLTAFFFVEGASGTDMVLEDDGPSAVTRVAAAVGVLLALLLPWFVARWARKAWLGYLLLGAFLTLAVLVAGLVMFGVL